MTFDKERLSQLLQRAQGSRTREKYANDAGISLTYVSELIKMKKDGPPGPDTLKKLSDAAQRGVTYFELMVAAGHLPPTIQLADPIPANYIQIPVYGYVKAGYDGIIFEEDLGVETTDPRCINDGGEYVWLRVMGDSMVGDGIMDGDMALVRLQPDAENGNLVVAMIDKEEGTLKRIYKDNGTVILQSANPSYPPRIISKANTDDFKIVGIVKQVKRYI